MRFGISEGQAVGLLYEHFGLEAPVAFEDVKKEYRTRSKRLHPDLNGSTQAATEAFQSFTNAFDELKKLYESGSALFDAVPQGEPPSGEFRPGTVPRHTVDGTPLSELGLGLGPTTNGKDCTECNHRGYKVVTEHLSPFCHSCYGGGTVMDYRTFSRRACRPCNGTGLPPKDRVPKVYVLKCSRCRGTGETEVLNPVLPKGRLVFTGKPSSAEQKDTKPYTPPKKTTPGADKLFKQPPRSLDDLLAELQRKGVGGKR